MLVNHYQVALTTTLIWSLAIPSQAGYSDEFCCELAVARGQYKSNSSNPICGQKYNESIAAAENVLVSHSFCKRECGGWGLSLHDEPDQWAGSLFQFLIPSIVFSMNIPRRRKLKLDIHFSKKSLLGPRLGLLVNLPLTIIGIVIDNFVWIVMILTFSGPMMMSALYEAAIDQRIISFLTDTIEEWAPTGGPNQPNTTDDEAMNISKVVDLLATVVSGNLIRLHGDSQTEITSEIKACHGDKRRAKLIAIMTSQATFGALVGGPVLFYLCTFAYTIMDLKDNPSDQDAALSLAFGSEWMIIVHVAIVSGVLLASNNPSSSIVLTGKFNDPPPGTPLNDTQAQPTSLRTKFITKVAGWLTKFSYLENVHESRYQPVTLWSRGKSKQEWLVNCVDIWEHDRHKGKLRLSFWWHLAILILTIVLVSIPSIVAAVLAWYTPPVGWGCRSLTCILYGACQIPIIFYLQTAHWFDTKLQSSNPDSQLTISNRLDRHRRHWRSEFRWAVITVIINTLWKFVLAITAWFLFLFFLLSVIVVIFVGFIGTLLQVIGVYRNCFCYTTASNWLHLDAAEVNVASDTQGRRASSAQWEKFGFVGIGFMGACALLGWWSQRAIRKQYRVIVDKLYYADMNRVMQSTPRSDRNAAPALQPNQVRAVGGPAPVPTPSPSSAASFAQSGPPTLPPVQVGRHSIYLT